MRKFKAIVFDHDGTLVDTSSYQRLLYPGVKEMLTELAELGVDLYVWTARERGSLVEILQYLDIIGHFKLLSCGGETAAKPSALGISEMIFNIDPSEVVVIGDSLGDMQGGKSFGGYCVVAMWSHGQDEARKMYQEAGANECFLDVEDCLKFLKENIEGKHV